MLHSMHTIRGECGSYKLNIISLSCFDDNRYILDDGINTLTYGHFQIKN